MTFINSRYIKIIFFIVLTSVIISCENNHKSDLHLLDQLPDKGIVLTPNDLFSDELNNSRFLFFSKITEMQADSNRIFNEDEFYGYVRSMGVQFILIPSYLQKNKNSDFPWMLNKRFQVCPGGPDKKYDYYYILLNWDNTTNSFHFYKFIYTE